jgi:ribosomal protein S12 methylthiotransferase
VDQEILIAADKRRLRRGCFYDVLITDAEDYDLFGEVIDTRSAKCSKR